MEQLVRMCLNVRDSRYFYFFVEELVLPRMITRKRIVCHVINTFLHRLLNSLKLYPYTMKARILVNSILPVQVHSSTRSHVCRKEA